MKKNLGAVLILAAPLLVLMSCKGEAGGYYPLGEGVTWKYQTIAKGPERAETSEITITNLPARELNGKSVVPQKMDAGGNSRFSFVASDTTGIYEVARQSLEDADPRPLVPPAYLIKFPIQAGASWETNDRVGSNSAFLEEVPVTLKCKIEGLDDSITVPAGTLKGMKVSCQGLGAKLIKMQRKCVAALEVQAWYAPGIGTVRWIRDEGIERPGIFGGTLYKLHRAMELVSVRK